MLVLQRVQHGQVPRPTILHEYQIWCSASRGPERQRPGEHPGAPQIPRWEGRLLYFVEMSGVRTAIGDNDVEENGAARLEGGLRGRWRRGATGMGITYPSPSLHLLFLFPSSLSFKRAPSHRLGASCTLGSEYPYIVSLVGGLPFSLSVAVASVSHGWRYPLFTVTGSSALSPLSLTNYPIQSTRPP